MVWAEVAWPTEHAPADAAFGSAPWSWYATDRTWRVLDEVAAIAAETGRTAAQVSLRWFCCSARRSPPRSSARAPSTT
jgi:aryl-alcohol dehydrogenase-like predicted oxidoreductase